MDDEQESSVTLEEWNTSCYEADLDRMFDRIMRKRSRVFFDGVIVGLMMGLGMSVAFHLGRNFP